MRKILLPVIAGILILGLLGLDEALAALKLSGGGPVPLPVPGPLNFTVTNTGTNPVTVTGISIFADSEPEIRKIQPFTFDEKDSIIANFQSCEPTENFTPNPGCTDDVPLLLPGEYFIFHPELLVNGEPVELKKKTLVSVQGQEEEPNPRDADNPKVKKVKAKKKYKT